MSLKRHRDHSGREERKRNDTLVSTLQKEYGEKFAPDVKTRMELGALKNKIGLEPDASLNAVLRHYKLKK